MSYEQYQAVGRPKVLGAWNMSKALDITALDFFVALSSVAGIVGNRGQAAYAAANTFLDAFVAYWHQRGVLATSLDLTAVEGVGYLAEHAEKQAEVLKTLSGTTMTESEVLYLIEAAMKGDIAGTCNGQCITGLDFQYPANLPFYAGNGKFSQLRQAALAT